VTGAGDFGLRLLDVPPAAPVLFAMDLATAAIALGSGCQQLLANPQTAGLVVANGNGHAVLPLPIPLRPALLGLTVHAQAAALAAPAPLLGVLRLSDRLTLRVGD
jgi:hypothetical protein